MTLSVSPFSGLNARSRFRPFSAILLNINTLPTFYHSSKAANSSSSPNAASPPAEARWREIISTLSSLALPGPLPWHPSLERKSNYAGPSSVIREVRAFDTRWLKLMPDTVLIYYHVNWYSRPKHLITLPARVVLQSNRSLQLSAFAGRRRPSENPIRPGRRGGVQEPRIFTPCGLCWNSRAPGCAALSLQGNVERDSRILTRTMKVPSRVDLL